MKIRPDDLNDRVANKLGSPGNVQNVQESSTGAETIAVPAVPGYICKLLVTSRRCREGKVCVGFGKTKGPIE